MMATPELKSDNNHSYIKRDLSLITKKLTFGAIENFVKKTTKSSGESHISKGYKYYCEGYVHDITLSTNDSSCEIQGRCFKSQKKNEAPHTLSIRVTEIATTDDVSIDQGSCTCAKGEGKACGHVVGLLYQVAHYKRLDLKAIPTDIAKTSLPQTWHKPRGPKIGEGLVEETVVVGYSKSTATNPDKRLLKSTLYNPFREPLPSMTGLHDALKEVAPNMAILPALEFYGENTEREQTKFGTFQRGSVIAVHQKLHSDYVLNIYDGFEFPKLPVSNKINNNFMWVPTVKHMIAIDNLTLSIDDVDHFEKLTRLQSEMPLWHKLRQNRITASKIHKVRTRRKDFESLAVQLKSTGHRQTQAMKDGLADEPIAAESYCTIQQNNVNMYPSGIIISPWAPWLAVSPDRKLYIPARNPNIGLLEIKCPRVNSVLECKYLERRNTNLHLKRNHEYYTQVQAQMAVTGLEWCDFFVWCRNDHHLETIYFDVDLWQQVKDKCDEFYINYFI